MSFYLIELLLTNVIEVFLASYVLTMVAAGAVINSLRLLDFPVLLPAVSGVSILALFMGLILCLNDSVNQSMLCYGFSGTTSSDYATLNIKLLCLCLTLLVLLAGRDYLKQVTLDGFESNQLLILAVIGLIIMASSNDLISIYLAIELQSLCFYAIIGMNSHSEIAIEASLKYFVFGALASCLLLFGFALIYSAFGTTLLNNLFVLNWSTVTVEHNGLGLLFVFVAFLIKLGVAPFHVWVCDVYEGTSTAITSFFASAPKVLLVWVFLKLSHTAFSSQFEIWSELFLFCGVLSLIWATFGALYQKRLKRLLAYSAIGHVGFVSLALCCNTTYSIQSSLIYISLYAIMSVAPFFIFMMVSSVKNKSLAKHLINWTSLSSTNLTLSLMFGLVLLSTAGIPPLAGFFTKLTVVLSLIEQSNLIVSGIVVIFSCISCFYYIRLIKLMFFTKSTVKHLWTTCKTRSLEITTALVTIIVTLTLIKPNLVLSVTALTALCLA